MGAFCSVGNVNTEVRIEWYLRFNGKKMNVFIIGFGVLGFFSDEIITGAMRFIVLGNPKHR